MTVLVILTLQSRNVSLEYALNIHIDNMKMFQSTLPLLLFTTLTVESSEPVATSTLSLCASMHVIEPWWDVPSGEWSNYNLVFSYHYLHVVVICLWKCINISQYCQGLVYKVLQTKLLQKQNAAVNTVYVALHQTFKYSSLCVTIIFNSLSFLVFKTKTSTNIYVPDFQRKIMLH